MDQRHSTNIVRLLDREGPSLTGTLARHLMASGLSAVAARQRISRLPDGVKILHGLPFPRRSRFVYLESQFGSEKYWTALISAIESANPSYAAALAGVRARGGIVLKSHFDIVSGAPVRQSGQIASAVVLKRLQSVDLLSVVNIEGLGECVVLGGEGTVSAESLGYLRARLVTENFLLDAIRGWLGRMNMASPNVTEIREDSVRPQFATFRFDICGPSYLRPLIRIRKQKTDPGFLVADAIVGRVLDERSVMPFLRKCVTLAHLRKVRPFLPMLIADGFTPEALHACRSRGIIATRPETLFGKDVARALNDLLQTLSKAAAIAVGNPGRIENLFEKLSVIEGSAGNLRGALFEILVGHVVHAIEAGSIDIGALVQDSKTGKRAEIDVRLVKERTVRIYECKGYQPSTSIGKDEIERWLEERVPVIYRAHLAERRFENCRLKFEYWTCGHFDKDAEAHFRVAKKRTKKYDLDWKDGAAVREYISQIHAPGIRKIFDEHYFKHPLSKMLAGPHKRTVEKNRNSGHVL